jgi:hypothetical protein
VDNSNRPSIRAYVGATGSGKGVSVREHVRDEKPARLLVWDPLGEYGWCCDLVTGDLAAVARALERAGERGAFAIAFYPGPDAGKFASNFERFCRMAWSIGNCTVLVEELSDVTTASFAPQPWARLVRQGRHRGLRLIGCTQRPARVDKDFLGNATYVRVFQLSWPDDYQVMAKCVRAPMEDVEALVTTEEETFTTINFIERDKATGKTTPGQLRIDRKG